MYIRGFFDSVETLLSKFGITGNTSLAVAQAFAAPTLANINNVIAAFQAESATPPPELMNVLYARYYDSIRSTPFYQSGQLTQAIGNYGPWLLLGGLMIAALALRKKRG